MSRNKRRKQAIETLTFAWFIFSFPTHSGKGSSLLALASNCKHRDTGTIGLAYVGDNQAGICKGYRFKLKIKAYS